MATKISTRLLLLEALAELGPSHGRDIRKKTEVSKGSLYAGLTRCLELGYVTATGEGEERTWEITDLGKAVAGALRTLHDANEPFG